ITFTVIYVANDGSGTQMDNTNCTYDSDCYITKNTYTKTGYIFKNWANPDKSRYFEDGENVKNARTTDTTLFLYAQWEPITYTITYDKNGGSGSMANTKCTYGTLCVLDKNTFYKAGYEFDGWLFNNEKFTDGQSVSDLTVVNTDNLVFVAQWKPAVISCPAGQYLNGLDCNNCEDEYYCEGGEWLYDGGIHGRKDCPVTTETYGAAENLGFLDVLDHTPHTSIEECRATFGYAPEWFKPATPDMEFNAGYNPQANNRGAYFVSCDYNSDTKQYDSNCTGFPLSCGAGYVSSTNVDLTEFEDLSQNLYYATSPQDAIEKTCVPVGYNHWSPDMQECLSKPDAEIMTCGTYTVIHIISRLT
ncbi:MAG: InlB B-repeat-containing protein, partial [Alphaproteobacteria bacterium]|nr:InlB B-repeat-containing protein [Alphaproteobacteria bacterium]